MGQKCPFYPVVVSAKPRQDGNLSSYTNSHSQRLTLQATRGRQRWVLQAQGSALCSCWGWDGVGVSEGNPRPW